MQGEASGRRGGRASDKAGVRDDEKVAGALEDVYRPSPEEHSWQGGKDDGDHGMGYGSAEAKSPEARRDKAKDSLAGQRKELEDKLRSHMLTQEKYDEMVKKLDDPDAVISYGKSGYEKSGTMTREERAGMDEYTEHETGEEIDKEQSEPDFIERTKRALDEPVRHGRWGGRGSDTAPTRDDYDAETKKAALKQQLKDGVITPQEHDRQLREIMPSINYKSAGAVRQR